MPARFVEAARMEEEPFARRANWAAATVSARSAVSRHCGHGTVNREFKAFPVKASGSPPWTRFELLRHDFTALEPGQVICLHTVQREIDIFVQDGYPAMTRLANPLFWNLFSELRTSGNVALWR